MTLAPSGADPAFGDLVQPFQIESLGLRGRLVRMGPALVDLLGRHRYPEPVAALMAEALCLTALLSTALKYRGVITLQVQGDGPISMMVIDVTHDGVMRGYARFVEDRLRAAMAAAAGGGQRQSMDNPVPRLLGAGHLAFTIDRDADVDRFQGITELTGATLADCAHTYFRQSEQLETAIMLAAGQGRGRDPGPNRAAGLMIQRLASAAKGRDVEDDDENWRQAVALMSSLGRDELLDRSLSAGEVLYRLFHQQGVRVYKTRPLRRGCRCSRQKVEATLAAFPRHQVQDMMEDGRITVTCEFCKTSHVFNQAALDGLG